MFHFVIRTIQKSRYCRQIHNFGDTGVCISGLEGEKVEKKGTNLTMFFYGNFLYGVCYDKWYMIAKIVLKCDLRNMITWIW